MHVSIRIRSLHARWMIVLGLVATSQEAPAQILREDFWVTDGSVAAVAADAGTVYIGGLFTRVSPVIHHAAPLDAATAELQGFPRVDGTVSRFVSDGSGGWYLIGTFTHVGGAPRDGLAHVTSAFGVTPWAPSVDGVVYDLVVVGSTVYVAGNFTNLGGEWRNYIGALDAVTGNVTPWDPQADDQVMCIASTGSTIVAGGFFDVIGGQPRARLATLDPVTGSATSWIADLEVTPTYAHVRDLDVSGATVYLAGVFNGIAGQSRKNLASVDAVTGSVGVWDPNPDGTLANRLEVSGSTVYAVGDFKNVGGAARNTLAALDAVTGAATTWNPAASSAVSTLDVEGPIVYVGGSFGTIGGQSRSFVAALDATTGLATPWNPGSNGSVSAIAAAGSTVFAGGGFSAIGGKPRRNLAALDVATGRPTSFDPSPDRRVKALALVGSTLYVGGSFTTIGGQSRLALAALDAASGTPTAWDPQPSSDVECIVPSGSTLYVAGLFYEVAGQERSFVASFSIDDGALTGWDPGVFPGPAYAIAVNGNTVYIGGHFGYAGVDERRNLAAVDAISGAAFPWNPGADNSVYALAVVGSTVFVGGRFEMVGGQSRIACAAVAANGSLLPWNPNITDFAVPSVEDLLVVDQTVYLGGRFSLPGRSNLAALSVTTALPTDWAPQPGSQVDAIVDVGQALYVGGSFPSISGESRRAVAGYLVEGTTDVTGPGPAGDLVLERVAPNPASGPVGIDYMIERQMPVRLGVFDLQGREVIRLVDGVRAPGRHHVEWSATGPGSTRIAAGVYFVRCQSEEQIDSKRVILVH